jgi:D-glycero-alpha-D-manno-heptose-7-phosphate kinase
LRITLGGGGTDLPSYYEKFGGLVLSAAIDRYVYVAINRTFTDDYFLKYSAIERVQRIEDIEHPIIREALRLHPIGPAIELVSVADIPAGTGSRLFGHLHGGPAQEHLRLSCART